MVNKKEEAKNSTSNKFLLVAKHTLTQWQWAFKNALEIGTVNFTNSLSPPSILKNVHTESKNSQRTFKSDAG